jgi:hypothetical protein
MCLAYADTPEEAQDLRAALERSKLPPQHQYPREIGRR